MGYKPQTMANLPVWIVLGFFMSSCVQSLESGNTNWEKYGASKNMVTDLPGQPKVGFRHYAGYVTVNEKHGRALFYWFFEAASFKEEKPLVLWLNGGPGCSSVGYGATQEIGPFLVDGNGTGLIFNKHSWNQESNLLFVESPVGVGFSYSKTSSDYKILGDNITATDTYMFLQNWFKRFPTYRTHDFYIAGESYGGKYVPELAELIYDLNGIPHGHPYIKLKGFMVGNPETHDGHDWEGLVDYAWSHAVVSDGTHKIIKDNCNFDSNDTWSNQNCTQAVNEVLQQYQEIDMYSLYTPLCLHRNRNGSETTTTKSKSFKTSTTTIPRKMLGGYDPCLDDYAKIYYNRYDVQRALHVTNDGHLKNWSICNMDIFHNWADSQFSVLPIYLKLIAAGLRIWALGALGIIVIRQEYMTADPFSEHAIISVGGWIQEYEGLTFATFRGAGHSVPIFKPNSALAFFRSYLSGISLPNER
eukprot:Gb_20297 [translate_table: standard]